MEALSRSLQGYKDIIASVAGVVTIAQFLSGAFICKDIYQKGNTEGIPCNPFVGGIVIGILMLQYAALLNDSAMYVVNIAAIVLNVLYLSFYYIYAEKKSDVWRALSIGFGIIAVLLGYAHMENEKLVEYRFGLIVTVLMLALVGSPLLEVRDVIEKKDSSAIPFPIVLSGTVVSVLWLLYGIILLNDFMINVVGLLLCLVQVVLCLIYPSNIKEKTQ